MLAHTRPGCLGFALLLVTTASCDKLPFLGDKDAEKIPEHGHPEQENEHDGEDDAASHQAEIDEAKKAAVAEHAAQTESEIQARVAAETQKAVDAHKKKLEDKAASDEADQRPLKLSDLSISAGGLFGPSNGTLQISAIAELQQKISANTYVHVKASCEDGARVYVDTSSLNPDFSKQLDTRAVGDKVEIKGSLFSKGLDHSLAPCRLQFRLGGAGSGGLSTELGEGCWNDNKATLSPCETPVVTVAASGAATPVEVLGVTRVPSMGTGARGLSFNYAFLFHEPYDPRQRLTIKSACYEGDKAFVEVGQAYFTTGPFKLEVGEAMARNANFYWSDTYGFAGPPTLCDLTVSLWNLKPGSYTYQERALYDGCFRSGSVDKGRCDGGSAPRGTASSPMTGANITLDRVTLALAEVYGSTGKFNLLIGADLTVSAPISSDQGISGQVTCKVGRDTLVEKASLYGVELHYLLAGETAYLTTSAFGSNQLENPRWCQIEFSGGARYSATGGATALGKYCLKKGKLKRGKC